MGSLIKELPRIEERDWRCMLKERLRHAPWSRRSSDRPLLVASGQNESAPKPGRPQAYHQRLVGLIDGKQGAAGNDQGHEHQSSKDTAGDIEPHRLPPVCGVWAGFGGAAGLGFCGRVNSVSGR